MPQLTTWPWLSIACWPRSSLPSPQRELLRAKRTLITRHDSDLKVRLLLPLPGSVC